MPGLVRYVLNGNDDSPANGQASGKQRPLLRRGKGIRVRMLGLGNAQQSRCPVLLLYHMRADVGRAPLRKDSSPCALRIGPLRLYRAWLTLMPRSASSTLSSGAGDQPCGAL